MMRETRLESSAETAMATARIGLAGAGRADTEYKVIAFDRFQIAALIDGLRG